MTLDVKAVEKWKEDFTSVELMIPILFLTCRNLYKDEI